mmetsp:Transcript_24199/g.59256  ORF Transcript_24199/g.59256 Transcript_24199/m.59256 type:complete len:312 (+) Transcript_24199:60-995(+)
MDQQIDTKPLQDEHGRLIGYTCEGAENDADVQEVATSFYFGLQYPIGQQTAAVEYINQALLEDVARDYHLISGTACNVLYDSSSSSSTPMTAQEDQEQSMLVSIQSNINRVELFQSCTDQNSFDPSLQDCQTSQLILKGLVWNTAAMPDVISSVESWLQGNGNNNGDGQSSSSSPALSNNNNNPYLIHYLGGQELEDQMVISTGAGRPTYPDYQQKQEENVTQNSNAVTGLHRMSPLGKAVVCLLVLAFLGLILAFLRKQQLQKERDEERRRAANKGNEIIVPELADGASSSSPSSKGDLSMTGSISAGSA